MAKIAIPTKEVIDQWLEYNLQAWKALPAIEAEIDTWDIDDQVDYVIEWGLREEEFSRLKEYATSGVMTEKQRKLYEQLEKVVSENRPILERLKES